MKAHHLLSVFALFFSALVWGCGGGHDAHITAVLDSADSLLRTSDTAAHSAALRQMEALDTARALQADEALRARHALLLTQARYKCYVTEPADSGLMEIARNYYAEHHSSAQDHELYTRALIYSGCVAEELGHPQQAMQFYLEAEDTADPTDHFNLGYINLRIAEIYQAQYTADTTDLVRYKQALPYFRKVGNIHYQAVCLTGIGGLYRTRNNDSAFHYIQQSIQFSKAHILPYFYYKSLDKLCGLYYFEGEYQHAKDIAVLIASDTASSIYDSYDYLYFGISSYAKLGMTDSAEYYLKLLPAPQTKVDSIMYHKALLAIAESNGEDKSVISHYLKSDEITDSIIVQSKAELLKSTEQEHHTEQLKNETEKAKGKVWLLSIIIGAIVIFFGYFIFKHCQDKKKWQSLVTELYENRNELEDNHTDLLAATKKHEALRALLMQHFQLMDELIKLGDSNPNSKLSQQLKDQIRATYSDKNFVTEMRNFVSMHADETLTDFLASCDKNLNETENNIVTLTACGFSSPEIALLTNQKDASYIRVAQLRIAKKLHLDTTLKVFLSSHFKP